MIPPKPPAAAARHASLRTEPFLPLVEAVGSSQGRLGDIADGGKDLCLRHLPRFGLDNVAGPCLTQKQLVAFCGRSSFLCCVHLEAQAGAPCSQSGEKVGRCRCSQQVHFISPKFSQVPSAPWPPWWVPCSQSQPIHSLLVSPALLPSGHPTSFRNFSWHLPDRTPSS